MKAIVNGRILLPDETVEGKALLYNDRIVGLADPADAGDADTLDARGAYVAPGFVDTHIHGYEGADASDGDEAGLRRMAKELLKNGVTSFLPTTMTVPWDELERALGVIRALMPVSRQAEFEGAEILGCHAEGPFIQPKRKGAQQERAILPPDAEKILPYADVIRVLTFAPEMTGAPEMLRTLAEKTQIALSVGHTDAAYEQAKAAVALGAGRFTHLFNAMPPLHHRAPGPVGAALNTDAFIEVIADGFHVHPALFPMLRQMKAKRLVLMTDATRAAGMPDGEYSLGGQRLTLRGVECRLKDGTIAGSVLKMNEAVRNYRAFTGAPMHEAVRCASLQAAESAGVSERKGALTPGKDADIVLMDEDCAVRAAIVRGNVKYRRD